MAFNAELYTHPSDRAALGALKAIPGFTQILRGFMNVWNEPQARILNMSSRVRLGENQLPEIHRMLPPICEKLGIDVPDLYLEMNVVPNAYTSGDNKPFIVLTSGLLDTLPQHLVSTVIAHECGHIACHHVLYLTMGRTILNGAAGALGLFRFGGLLTIPLQVAFYYWMRCSEFSADRAAVLVDGHAGRMQEVCMRLAGLDNSIQGEHSMAAFLEQAREYRQMVNDSRWNKTLEFALLSGASHPLMAVRALECGEWAVSDRFRDLLTGKLPAPEALPPQSAGPAPDGQPADSAQEDKPQGGNAFDLMGFLRKQIPDGLIPNGLFQKGGKAPETPPDAGPAAPAGTAAEEIAQYKALMDAGIITPEEFAAKKKQLLGL